MLDDLYHNAPVVILPRSEHRAALARYVRRLHNGRALVIEYTGCANGKTGLPVTMLVDPACVALADRGTEPPPLPFWACGPMCPDCGAWPLDHRGGVAWWCARCHVEVHETKGARVCTR